MRASTLQNAQHGLHVISGDWRVSADGVRLAQQTAIHSGVGTFVQALMARHKSWQTHGPRLDFILRRRPSGITMSPIYHQVHVQAAPRLHLTIRGETHVRHERSIARTERTLREQLVHYLSARGTRIDAVATPGRLTARGSHDAPSPGTRADLPLARPVPRVVRRPHTELAPDDRGLSAETAMTLPGRRPVVASRMDAPAPAAIDVHRLTDQVIQAIDRRIVAQRERLGRI
jgi:hypothetical protein